MDIFTMKFIDDAYYSYLKSLSFAGTEHPIPDHELAMLRGHITLEECFTLGVLCNG